MGVQEQRLQAIEKKVDSIKSAVLTLLAAFAALQNQPAVTENPEINDELERMEAALSSVATSLGIPADVVENVDPAPIPDPVPEPEPNPNPNPVEG